MEEAKKQNRWFRSFRKGAVSAALAGTLALSVPFGSAMADYRGYADVPEDHWAAKAEVVDYAIDRGLLSGYSEAAWGPDDPVTRGQLAVIMYRICMPEVACYYSDFAVGDKDPFRNETGVVNSTYYHYPMSWAYHNGLIKGNGVRICGNGGGVWGNAGDILPDSYESLGASGFYAEPYVRGDDPITREELATMLMRMEQYRGTYDAAEADYAALDAAPDVASVSSWARDAVAWAIGKGLIDGRPGEGIAPQGAATRAETAKMLMVCLEGEGFVPSEHEKLWVDGRVYTVQLVWTCLPDFGMGCGASSTESRDAIPHYPGCPALRGEETMITMSNTDPAWIDLGTATGTAYQDAMDVAARYGIPTGWYEWK